MRKPSVRLSVKRVDYEKTKESSDRILTNNERSFILFSSQKRMVGGFNPFYLEFWLKLILLERKRRFSIDIHA